MGSLPEYETTTQRKIEVRGFKWPQRPTAIAMATYLGEDKFGRWLGLKPGDPWWTADRSHQGVFEHAFVKLVPQDTFWTACFHTVGPIVDVDIVLPVKWQGDVLEEVDLELDILRSAEGEVFVRDQDEFEQVRVQWEIPDHLLRQAQATCAHIYTLAEGGAEPFGTVGQTWLAHFLANVEQENSL